MTEVLIGALIFAIGLGSGYFVYMKMEPQPPMEIHIPEIKFPDITITIPEIVVKGAAHANTVDYQEMILKYEKDLEKDMSDKDKEMTQEYHDLNESAMNLVEDYIGKGVKLDE